MSYKLVDLCFDIPGIDQYEFAVLMALCRSASNEDHTCFPSRPVIAKAAHVSERQVQRTIPNLVSRGFVTLLSQGRGRGVRSQYRINVDCIRELTENGAAQTPYIEENEKETITAIGDGLTPYLGEKETTASLKGDQQVCEKETDGCIKGDHDACYIGRICKESVSSESVNESVTLSVAMQPHPAVAGVVVSGLSEGFVISPEEAIYQAYPRKEGHAVAIRAIEKAVKKLVDGKTQFKRPRMSKREAQKLLSDVVEIYARSPAGQNPERKFIPHPATWFNGERWDDDQEEWQHTGATNGRSNRMEAIRDSTRGAMEILNRTSALDIINGSKSKYAHSIFDRAFAVKQEVLAGRAAKRSREQQILDSAQRFEQKILQKLNQQSEERKENR